MSSIHVSRAALLQGWCSWRWHWEDVDLACTDRAVPGTAFCADHFIEYVQNGGGDLPAGVVNS